MIRRWLSPFRRIYADIFIIFADAFIRFFDIIFDIIFITHYCRRYSRGAPLMPPFRHFRRHC